MSRTFTAGVVGMMPIFQANMQGPDSGAHTFPVRPKMTQTYNSNIDRILTIHDNSIDSIDSQIAFSTWILFLDLVTTEPSPRGVWRKRERSCRQPLPLRVVRGVMGHGGLVKPWRNRRNRKVGGMGKYMLLGEYIYICMCIYISVCVYVCELMLNFRKRIYNPIVIVPINIGFLMKMTHPSALQLVPPSKLNPSACHPWNRWQAWLRAGHGPFRHMPEYPINILKLVVVFHRPFSFSSWLTVVLDPVPCPPTMKKTNT
jgi:hypothetical protein